VKSLSPVRQDLLPPLRALVELLREEGCVREASFFESALTALEAASAPEDLADPFMQLSTSAFQGFRLSEAACGLLDHVLLAAQTLASTLSARDDAMH